MPQIRTAVGPADLKRYGEEWRYERDLLPLKIRMDFVHYIPCGIQLLQWYHNQQPLETWFKMI